MARPSKNTAQRRAQILERVRAGDSLELAAGSIGVSKRSLLRWLAAQPEFRADVGEARIAADDDPVALALRATRGGLEAALAPLDDLDDWLA